MCLRRTLFLATLTLAAVILTTPVLAKQVPSNHPTAPSSDLLSALRDSGMDLDRPVLLEPVAYDADREVATYRLSADGQKTRFRRVSTHVDPTIVPAEEPETDAKRARDRQVDEALDNSAFLGNLKGIIIGNTASGRCDLRLFEGTFQVNELYRTNLDANNLKSVSKSINDTASSLRTFCSPVLVFEHKHWNGASLFVPANTVINDLAQNGMNNRISSHFIICD